MKNFFKSLHIPSILNLRIFKRRSSWVGFVLLLILVSSQEVKGQQDFINGFYMLNPLAFNPAIAGVNDEIVASAIVREQWTGLSGAPSTQYVNFHMPVFSWFDRYDRPGNIDYPTGLSTGLMLLNDKIGPTQFMRASVPMATRVRLTRSGIRLSLGLRIDASRFSANYIGLREDQLGTDQTTGPAHYSVNFSTGLYAYHTKWYVGLSMGNMRTVDVSSFQFKFVPHYYASAGYAHPINKDLVLRVTSLATMVVGTPPSVTITPAVIINEKIETGLSYRYDDMIGAFFSFNPTRKLTLGYWYEYPTGVKTGRVGATHELAIQLTLERFKKRVVSPRYFW